MAKLGAKNGVLSATYKFRKVPSNAYDASSNNYKRIMISECKKFSMKPVCDHPSYCKNDKQALYIGQSKHLSKQQDRGTASYNPGGFDKIMSNWNGLCSYTGAAGNPRALCNIPVNTHSWQYVNKVNPGFICGKEKGTGGRHTSIPHALLPSLPPSLLPS